MRISHILLFLILPFICLSQRIAVLEFKPGVGVSTADVDGLSSIFVTYFAPEGYTLVERSQIDRVIDEQNFQRSKMTESQMVRVGEILNLSKLVVGNINVIMGEYNVDVRVINVESGTIMATDGASFVAGGYREGMRQLAVNIARKIENKPVAATRTQSKDRIYSDEVLNALIPQPQPLSIPVVYKGGIRYVTIDTAEKMIEEEQEYIRVYGEEELLKNNISQIPIVMIQGGEDAFGVYYINDGEGDRQDWETVLTVDDAYRNDPQKYCTLHIPSKEQFRKINATVNDLNSVISRMGGEPLKSEYWTNEFSLSGQDIFCSQVRFWL